MHLLEERLDDLLVCALVVFNVFIELLANVVVFGVHALLGLPPRVRVHPVLDDPRLIARRQVNELVDVLVQVVLDPLVVLHVHGLAFQVRAMNGALVHVHALQIINNYGADALHDAVRLREFQVLQRDFQRFHKIAQLDRILALRVQKHLHVELIGIMVNRIIICVRDMRHLCGVFFHCFNKRGNHVLVHHNHIFHKIFQIVNGCVISLTDALVLFGFIMLL